MRGRLKPDGVRNEMPRKGKERHRMRREGAKTNPTSLPSVSKVLREVSDASAETERLKPILSMGIRGKRGDGVAGDAFIYIHICTH